jgi:uncharacterized protein YbjT (DUF2867 family)
VKDLVEEGAEPCIGDVNNSAFVEEAFMGAEAIFAMIPPNLFSQNFYAEQEKIAQNYCDSVRKNNIKYAVLLSSVGAHLRHGAGIVDGLGKMEMLFAELKEVNILNLRPSYFMENLFGLIGTIKMMGVGGSPVRGDIPFPLVASKDIGEVALKRLQDLNFKGNTIEYVLGQRNVTYNEITEILGKVIGIPELKYIQFPYNDAKNAMVMSGFCSENVAGLMTKMAEAFNNGEALNDYKRTPENTTPTTIEEFAKTFAYVYNQRT